MAQFRSLHEGIGIFTLLPEKGQRYKASVVFNGQEKVFDLPKPLPSGYTLKVNARQEETLGLQLNSNTSKALSGALLLGHIRGQVFLTKRFEGGNSQKMLIDRATIPSGILHFTVFDDADRPVCERLVFNRNPNQRIDLEIKANRESYGYREMVSAKVVPMNNDTLVPASMSVAVFNQDLLKGQETKSEH